MNINLYLNYYFEKNIKRRVELDTCVAKNLKNPHLNVILFESNDRVKYSHFFKMINSYTAPDDINIISNLDIYFDNSVTKFKEMSAEQAFVLGRWDIQKDGKLKFANRPDSQDAWIFKGKVKSNLNGDFYLGWLGCDNRFCHEINKAGYKVSNPCKNIKAIHVHSSMIRNYKAKGRQRKSNEVPGPYMTLTPCDWEKRKR